MYDCFYFILFFALSQLPIVLSPKLDVYSCLGKTSYFSQNVFLLFSINPLQGREMSPPVWGTELATSVVAPTCIPSTAFQSAVFEFVDFFTTFHCVSASFFLTPRISFCADTFSRSNLHETILLRQAFCALLNDGCLREMIIMIDFQPQVTVSQ